MKKTNHATPAAPLLYQQRQGRYFGQINAGLEKLGATELKSLGASSTETVTRGVFFKADAAAVYRINYCARLFTRILAPLASFQCQDKNQLYQQAQQVDWRNFLSTRQSLAIFASIYESPAFNNAHYAGLVLKDAIVDQFRNRFKERPRVDTGQPDVWFNLRVDKQRATISLDTSGGSLHRRGYRSQQVPAPMQETLAAAMVRLSGWDDRYPLVDPMCGGGTLLGEALMAATNTPAQILRRRFGFSHLPDYDHALWLKIRKEMDQGMHFMPPGRLLGNDIEVAAIAATNQNLQKLPHGGMVKLQVGDFSKLTLRPRTTILCNPPFGIRLKTAEQIQRLYRRLGQWLRQRATGCTALIYFGAPQHMQWLELTPESTWALQNGGLNGSLARYEFKEG